VKRSFIREILESINNDTISFAGGLPDENLFPIEDLRQASDKVFSRPECLQYSLSSGIKALRDKIAQFYNRTGVVTDADNILVTTGSQQALYVIAKYFSNESIVIEEPSYMGATNIFKMNEMSMSPVPLYHDGIDIDTFEKLYQTAKLAYLIPDFHNPASSCYSVEKRKNVAEIALASDGYIIEDAPYSELYFDEKKASLVELAPERILHLGSFSKTLSPSLRIGWVRADKEIIKELTGIKEIIDLHSCGISQYILSEYLQDIDAYGKHLNSLRAAYKEKMETFAQALEKILPEFKFQKPEGGMFIYGHIEGADTFQLVQKCMDRGVVFVPGDQFYLDGRKTSEIRFNFTKPTAEQVEAGLKLIKEIM